MGHEPERTTAAERAHTAIRQAILSGEHPPGSMLSENVLAAAIGVSRTPVRTALSRLQDEGWVTIYPQRGVVVRELSEGEVQEAAEVRHALESAGVHRSDPQLRVLLTPRLADSIEEQARALAAGDIPAFASVAEGFHRTFVELAGNRVMLEVYDRLSDRQQLSIVRSAQRILADPEQVLAEHRVLAEDAGRGDWGAFGEHLEQHQTRSHGLRL
jgi:DNA-binding GntR family transcriptional regulator